MSTQIETLLCDNLCVDEEIAAFLAQDPEFVKAEREFYEVANELAQLAGYDLYDRFERRLGDYITRFGDTHYRFGLGLRQDILRAMGAGG